MRLPAPPIAASGLPIRTVSPATLDDEVERADQPGRRPEAVLAAGIVIGTFSLMASSVVITQFLHSALGLDPLVAALWSVLPAVGVGGAAPLAAKLSLGLGRPRVMVGGFLVTAVGFGVLTQVRMDGFVALAGAGLVVTRKFLVTYLPWQAQ